MCLTQTLYNNSHFVPVLPGIITLRRAPITLSRGRKDFFAKGIDNRGKAWYNKLATVPLVVRQVSSARPTPTQIKGSCAGLLSV